MNDRIIEGKGLRGIVLGAYDFGDSSKIIDLFTMGYGRISVMAKGARRPKSRLVNLCEPFVEGEYNLIHGKQFEYLKDGEIIDAHLALRGSIRRLSAATYCCELARRILLEDSDDDVFRLLQAGLSAVEAASETRLSKVLAAFVLKLASFIGFRPSLSRCVICGRAIQGKALFDAEQGGMLCAEHGDAHPWTARALDEVQHLELMRYISKPLSEIAAEDTAADGVSMHRLTFNYFKHHTGIPGIKSAGMLQRLALM